MEIAKITSRPAQTWDSHLALVVTRRVFISWEPPPLWYIRVNFDGSVRDSRGSAGFVIHSTGLGLMVARGMQLFESTVLVAELQRAWIGIFHAQRTLQADHLIIEGDSTIVVTWIQGCMQGEVVHPLLQNIMAILRGCTSIVVLYVYREANFTVDWILAYVVEYSGNHLWTDMREAPGQFSDIFLYDFYKCIYTLLV